MGSSQELYDRLSQKLMAICGDQTTNIKQIVNLIWLVIGVLNARSVALSQIGNSLPGQAEAESRVTRIRRWLSNGHVDVWALYRPLLATVLSGWYRTKMTVVVDGTLVFGDRLQIYRLSLLHGCRVSRGAVGLDRHPWHGRDRGQAHEEAVRTPGHIP